jgi:ABC-type lipoprotein export system ATPase subunit
MPNFEIVVRSKPTDSFRVAKIRGAYDLNDEEIVETFTGEIYLTSNWTVGAIVGPSGSGKTQILRHLWPSQCDKRYRWSAASFVDDFKAGDDDRLFSLLHRVGMGSIPSWLKSYSVLSMGERMRVDLARQLWEGEDIVVCDEFTSTVDRQIARIACVAVRKAIAQSGKRLIVASCHSDFLPWLKPDWLFSTTEMKQSKKVGRGSRCDSWSAKSTAKRGDFSGDITISLTI